MNHNKARPIKTFKLVGALGIAQILAWSSTYYLPAVLATPIAEDTGWSLTRVVIGLSWGLLIAGACSPLAGRQIDRLGGRSVLATSSVLLALGMLLMGLAQHLVTYYLAWTLVGAGMAAGLYDAAFSTLGRLLGANARASITGLTLIGGFASTLGWPLIAGMEHQVGWRFSCFALAAMHLVIGLPIHLMAIPREQDTLTETPIPMHPTGAASNPSGTSASQLLLLLAALLTLQSLVISTLSVHLLDVLKLLGIATATALAIGMMIGPSQVAARVAEFAIGRNLHPTWSTRLAIVLCGLGIGLLLPAMPWLGFVAMGLYGAGVGILTIARGTLPLALFGSAGYGTRMGQLARPMLLAQAAGPVGAALILEQFGSTFLLAVLCVLVGISLIISFALPAR
ncbi:MFS transporter [Halopseudomonas salegens]|uniref:Predicted arabinose efflux permease, MFS family n=1 Tax=Halopseudomonas salegens TaxID=1434072 RepID=A0A1H2HEV5_9GAMM|nr:MFS transporter [Halopseudomonas salegens]SDU30364.1 Predicted arabinose efflux permease, MFS family [Halopseudomonas salegens]